MPKRKPSKFARYAALAAILATSVACGGELDGSELDRYLCDAKMFGPDVHESARGELTADDLERMGDGDGQAPDDVVAAKFALYVRTLPRPPFDPPGDLVCQVVEFEDEQAAAGWVAGLDANQPLSGIVVGFLADGSFGREESVLPEYLDAAPGANLRIFSGSPGHDRARSFVMVAVGAEGRFVRALAMSGENYIDPQTDAVASWWLEASPD